MFKHSIEEVRKYTHSLLVSSRKVDETVSKGYGSCILINEEGYFLTCAHVFLINEDLSNHSILIEKNKKKRAEISSRKDINKSKIKQLLVNVVDKRNWLTNVSFYVPDFSANIDISSVKVNWDKDIAIFKLLDCNPVKEGIIYPKFYKNDFKIGTSLCRLGYPFNNVQVTWNDAKSMFIFNAKSDNYVYPIEGLLTTERHLIKNDKSKFQGLFIETSSPGLRGHSGGPIFDTEGLIYGIQSHTAHAYLGFDVEHVTDVRNSKSVIEYQYIHIGRGVHNKEIFAFLKGEKIKYYTN
jgi:hypothetical protein